MNMLFRIACASSLLVLSPFASAQRSGSIRLIDLNGDSQLDQLVNQPDGTLTVSLGLGQRQFETIRQVLPRVLATACLTTDLNGDGFTDLYLVTGHANRALIGDGRGFLTDATLELGLRDEGYGYGVESNDFDSDGFADILVHNQGGDVLFWGVPHSFERDAAMPFAPVDLPNNIDPITFLALSPLASELTNGSSNPSDTGDEAFGSTSREPYQANFPRNSTKATSTTPSIGAITPLPPGVLSNPRFAFKFPFGNGLTAKDRAILNLLSIEQIPDGVGGLAQTLRVTGANFQIVSGSGATNGNPLLPSSTLLTSTNGLGNLIVGYNELGNPNGDDRTGSHNIVVGHKNTYTEFGGLIAARQNSITSPFASVSGGRRNLASGLGASVSGGNRNTAGDVNSAIGGGVYNLAVGVYSSVSGGVFNSATGFVTAVSGGRYNTASGAYASVSGGSSNLASGGGSSATGFNNEAGGSYSTISGGRNNTAMGFSSSISGGRFNIATGPYSSISGGKTGKSDGYATSISGGQYNTANDNFASISGGVFNLADGFGSSITGGFSNSASGQYSVVSGGQANLANNYSSSVSGGYQNTTLGNYASVSGGRANTASGAFASISGGYINLASGADSSVSGGRLRSATGDFNWRAGGLLESN